VSAPTPQDGRHELLEPYLQRLRAFLRARGDEKRPLTIPSEPIPLVLSIEERKAAWSVLCDETVAWTDASAWIPLGAGLHLALAAALEDTSGAESGGGSGRLGAIAAVAAGYTEALRQAIAATVAGGQTDEAKRLSSFRNKLLEILTVLRATGAGSAPPMAEAKLDGASSDPPAGGSAEATPSIDTQATSDPALQPCLQRAAAFFRARGNEERSLTISFGKRTLSLSAWERRVVWESLCEGGATAREWHRLIPECVAVQLALLLALEELERSGGSAASEPAALQAVVSLAGGVVQRLRAQVERAVAAGALDDAKQLSTLSSAFGATLIDARRVLAEEPAGAAITDGGTGQRAATTAPETPPAAAGTAPAGPPERLKPFLDRAAHLLELRGHDDTPVSIPVGGRSWNLDGWERQVLWKVLCEEGQTLPEWSTLLAYGAAAQLAALLALERLMRAGAAGESRAAADADRDTAIELAREVAERLQATAEALTADGQVRLAERLTRFGAKLSALVELLRQTRSRSQPPA
jgi:hypothetical protein